MQVGVKSTFEKDGSNFHQPGKLGQTSTDFEVKHRNSARNLGIDHSEPEKAAREADCCAPFL